MKEINSIGIVKPKIFKCADPIKLSCGMTLDNYELIYETYGKLNKNKDNAVLVCHALSGNQHVAGRHKKTDKSRFFKWYKVNINVLRIVDVYALCVNQLSYVQLYEHHE